MAVDVAPPTTLLDGAFNVRKVNAKKLADGYTLKKRLMEYCYLSVATYLWVSHILIVAHYFMHGENSSLGELLWSPVMVALAMVLSDFISGVAHWSFDTWGTPETFFFGSFIRSFREHHVNQMAITKHDFVETNADTTLPLIPVLLVQRYFLCYANAGNQSPPCGVNRSNVGMHVFLLTLTLFIALTNELHKWAHTPAPHYLIRLLMRCGVVLTPKVHRRHHNGRYDSCYCITTGWLNAPLDKIDFWRRAEKLVSALTGAVPRANDREMLGVHCEVGGNPE
uniref:Uncharacterized protein TCIL3000_10_1860 n=1 Tax=Trypanosoma congolense (strain IL3000) TaxID=1068625 RepID=G0UVL1_TRYCI|nr:unnamed protein product [Trypanosoma congolense IL3000]